MMESIGAARLARLLGGNGVAARYQERIAISMSTDFDAFIRLLYEDLDSIINTFQANPQHRHKDGEDRLTEELVSNLGTAGYDASHDTSAGGHVDVTVKLGSHSWIGEAKKNSKFDEGFKQLSTRYRPVSGNFKHNHGGMILYYCSGADITTQLSRWRKKIPSLGFRNLTTDDCPVNEYAFYSTHTHDVTGKDFKVRHMAVGLIFNPIDRSARLSAAKQLEKN